MPRAILGTLALLALGTTPAPAQNEGAWERRDEPFPERRQRESLRIGPGARLVFRDGALGLRRRGEDVPLPCASPGGTGIVSDVALDPAGLVFVAAERGLFVFHESAEALDRVPAEEGAPPGRPDSVVVDARRRVWVATDEAFGVIDPSSFDGYTFRASDGLEGGGPFRVAEGPEGAFRVASSAGTFLYRPDLAPAPRVTMVELAPSAGAGAVRAAPGRIELSRVEAERSVALRYRVDGHHVWRPLVPPLAIDGLAPGWHEVEVVALDRDLGRSEPARARALVAAPPAMTRSVVVSVALAALALLVASFGAVALRRGGARALPRGLLSAAIAFCLLGQVVAGIEPHAKGWPFIGFAMYCYRYERGDVVHDAGLFALSDGGHARRLGTSELGTAVDSRWKVLRPLIDGGAAVAERYAADRRARFPAFRPAALQVRSARRRLTPEGAVVVAPLVLAHLPLEARHVD